MAQNGQETDELLRRASLGDEGAREQLLGRHRARLKRMVAVRLDRRLASRVDPSDIVQDALAHAARDLPDYLLRRPMAFYPWLRQIAWERLLQLRRRHIDAKKRSVEREEAAEIRLPDESVMRLADRLVASATSPSARIVRDELHQRVRIALDAMPPRDREVLVLRYLEQLTNGEIADVLGITEGAVKVRHLRALERLRTKLDDEVERGRCT